VKDLQLIGELKLLEQPENALRSRLLKPDIVSTIVSVSEGEDARQYQKSLTLGSSVEAIVNYLR
jgi:hypothetical protein